MTANRLELLLTQIAKAKSMDDLSRLLHDIEAKLIRDNAPTAQFEAVRHASRERTQYFARLASA